METLDCSGSLTQTRCAEGQFCEEALIKCMPCDSICNEVYSERCTISCPGYIRSPVAAPATTAGWAAIEPTQSAAQTIIISTVLVTLAVVIVLVAVLVYCVRKRAILPNRCRKLNKCASMLATCCMRRQAPSAAVQQHASSLINLLSQHPQLNNEALSTLEQLVAIVKERFDIIDCHKEDVFRREDETKTPLMSDDTISQPGGSCIMAGEVDSSSPVSNSVNASISSPVTAAAPAEDGRSISLDLRSDHQVRSKAQQEQRGAPATEPKQPHSGTGSSMELKQPYSATAMTPSIESNSGQLRQQEEDTSGAMDVPVAPPGHCLSSIRLGSGRPL